MRFLIGIQGTNPHIFLRNLKIWILKIFFSKLGVPKKMMPKSQAKNKSQFPQYPFLTILTTKKVSCKQIYNFKFTNIQFQI